MLSNSPTWDVFISHASEDKEEVARPLAEWLERYYGLKVWFDELELKAGDSLRRSIDRGVASSKFGVVVISKSFMSKHWPQEELAALATQEYVGDKAIIPIWHGVTHAEVRHWSPILADRIALNWTSTPSAVLDALVRAMDLPRNTLSGVWCGPTGRLRLRYDGDNYTSCQFYDGAYDWNGRDWSGQIRGAFSRDCVFLFEWSWDKGRNRGVGLLRFNAVENCLDGKWRIANDTPSFRGLERVDDTGHEIPTFSEFSEFALRELRQESTAWTFWRY